jgi:hypothetical protein
MVDQMIGDRLQNALEKGRNLRNQIQRDRRDGSWVESAPYLEWQSQTLTLLQTIFGLEHTYARNFESATTYLGVPTAQLYNAERGMGVLNAAAEDLVKGWAWQYREVLHAEVFDDLLDMADHLLQDGGYVDAAAVLAGGALEGHLRSLSQKHNVPIGKATVMNEALWKKGVYTKPTWRMVQGWYDLRSDAAHQKPGHRLVPDVTSMITGVRNFISQYPA